MELRPYQNEAVAAVFKEFQTIDSTLLVKATGTGKTVTFCDIAKRFAAHYPQKKILILAHRNELLEQAQEKLALFGLESAIEKAEETAHSSFGRAVVASVQSLSRPKRLEMYNPEQFSLIITDEAHHSVGESYRAIYRYFRNYKHLGVTATPNRHDEIGLKNIFQSCAFQYSIQDGIKDGYLCDIRGEQIKVEDLRLENLKIVAGDFSQSELDAMLRKESVLQGMVLPTIEHAGQRQTIVFTTGVEHAHEIAACFNRVHKNSAVAVDGAMDAETRSNAIEAFKSGKRQFIVNVGVLTEGFDYPPTACIALFRPTRSLGLLAQMIGRGTRIAEGKTDCKILDFVGVNNTVRTMTVMDVLDGTILNEQEHAKAQELQATGLNSMDALREAKLFVAQTCAIQAKMKALSTANAFDVLKMFAIPNARGLYGGDLATEKQVAYLTKQGIKCKPDLQKGEAMQLIGELIQRQSKGLATFKQIKYLKKLGHQDNFIEQTTFAEAGKLINEKLQKRNTAYA